MERSFVASRITIVATIANTPSLKNSILCIFSKMTLLKFSSLLRNLSNINTLFLRSTASKLTLLKALSSILETVMSPILRGLCREKSVEKHDINLVRDILVQYFRKKFNVLLIIRIARSDIPAIYGPVSSIYEIPKRMNNMKGRIKYERI